jgi:hypothetical protein
LIFDFLFKAIDDELKIFGICGKRFIFFKEINGERDLFWWLMFDTCNFSLFRDELRAFEHNL